MESKLKILIDGSKEWRNSEGQLHREDGPAIELPNGSRGWFYEGKHHRVDGPAIEHIDGDKSWWYKDKWFNVSSQEEFERLLNLLAFL